MRMNKVSPVSFQASIPSRLRNRLLMDALNLKQHRNFAEQCARIETWGYGTSSLMTVKNQNNKGIVSESLALANSYFAPLKNVLLPAKESLFASFMSLTKKDILDAEKVLKI